LTLSGSHIDQKWCCLPSPQLHIIDEAGDRGRAMKRRDFMKAIGVIAGFGSVAIPTMAQDQVRRVGALLVGAITKKFLEDGLRQLGWKLGNNLIIENRIYNGDTDP
jgi:hypothetical protein